MGVVLDFFAAEITTLEFHNKILLKKERKKSVKLKKKFLDCYIVQFKLFRNLEFLFSKNKMKN